MVDINCASESELVKLPGIGSKKARAIIQHRTTRGPFRKLWELTQIPGIGEATVRMLQPYVATLVDTNPCRQLRNRLVRPKATTAQDPVTCICSWNIQRLSLSKPDFALHLIADVMSAMHVVAVQEVMDVRVLEKLLVLLPNNWACHTSPQQGNPGSTYTESYALLYRADRFQLHDCFVVNADTAPVTRPPMVVVLQDQLTGRHTAYVNFHAVFQGSASAREAECPRSKRSRTSWPAWSTRASPATSTCRPTRPCGGRGPPAAGAPPCRSESQPLSWEARSTTFGCHPTHRRVDALEGC